MRLGFKFAVTSIPVKESLDRCTTSRIDGEIMLGGSNMALQDFDQKKQAALMCQRFMYSGLVESLI